MAIPKTIRLILLAIALVSIFLAQSGRAENAEPGREADFKWFSSLGFPEVVGAPFVRLATGGWVQSGGEPPQGVSVEGFLLATKGPVFRVFTLDLADETLTNFFDGTNAYQRIGFQTLDFKTAMGTELQELRSRPKHAGPDGVFQMPGIGEPLTERSRIFVLAWACWRRGLNDEAAELYDQAHQLPPRGRTDRGTNGFRLSLQQDIAQGMIWQGMASLLNPAISRPQLLEIFNRIAAHFPDGQYHDQAVTTAMILRRMVAEDEIHEKNAPVTLAKLSPADQARELIYRLRDQTGQAWMTSGFWEVLEAPQGGNTNTVANQLVHLGYAAVPQLIAALDDPSFTRTLRNEEMSTGPFAALTVGDCAADILLRITGHSFRRPGFDSRNGTKEGASAVHQAAEAWWAEFQRKGERQMLVEAVNPPGADARLAAEILCLKYPKVAVPTLMQGIRAATNDWVRASLVKTIARMHTPVVAGFLRNEMTNSPWSESRVAAADGLLGTDKGMAVSAMINEWVKLERTGSNQEGDGYIAEFLARCNSPEAIRTLAEGMQSWRPLFRVQVVDDIDDAIPRGYPGARPPSPATCQAMEDFLAQELQDTGECFAMSGSRNGKNYSDPLVGDLAATSLAEIWTNRYVFDLEASRKVRERQRIQCINSWRTARNMVLLPLPRESKVQVDPAQSGTVTAIEWEAGTIQPSSAFADTISAFKGKPLEAARIVDVLTGYVRAPEPQSATLRFKAIKDEDLTGVRLLVKLLPGQPSTSECCLAEQVTLGRKNLYGSSGEGQIGYYEGAGAWNYLADCMAQAIHGKPLTPFYISLQIGMTKLPDDGP